MQKKHATSTKKEMTSTSRKSFVTTKITDNRNSARSRRNTVWDKHNDNQAKSGVNKVLMALAKCRLKSEGNETDKISEAVLWDRDALQKWWVRWVPTGRWRHARAGRESTRGTKRARWFHPGCTSRNNTQQPPTAMRANERPVPWEIEDSFE